MLEWCINLEFIQGINAPFRYRGSSSLFISLLLRSRTVVYLASLCPVLAEGDSAAIKMEFHLFPARLSCSFSGTICNERNPDIPASPHYIRDAGCCSSTAALRVQSGREILQSGTRSPWGLQGQLCFEEFWEKPSVCEHQHLLKYVGVTLLYNSKGRRARSEARSALLQATATFICARDRRFPHACWKKQPRKIQILLAALFTAERGNGSGRSHFSVAVQVYGNPVLGRANSEGARAAARRGPVRGPAVPPSAAAAAPAPRSAPGSIPQTRF